MPSPLRLAVSLALATLVAAAAGCATLGPTPSTTAISPVEAGRTSVEVVAGGVPGYYLSSSTVAEPKGQPIGELAAVLEPGPDLGVPGLIVGGRVVGPDHDVQTEPMLGYRRTFGAERNVSGLAIIHAARGKASDGGASYTATRVGGEVAADLRVLGEGRWIEPHLFAAVSITGLSADGDYCVDATGRYGVDCPEPPATANRVTADVSGVYPAATVGVAVHGMAHRDSWFHGARAAMMMSAGAMPRLVSGMQEAPRGFFSLGITLSLAVGADK